MRDLVIFVVAAPRPTHRLSSLSFLTLSFSFRILSISAALLASS
jgi:hypothetical protein